jgi:hypothetical protein
MRIQRVQTFFTGDMRVRYICEGMGEALAARSGLLICTPTFKDVEGSSQVILSPRIIFSWWEHIAGC